MTAEERWKMQNKIHLKKERKKKLERFILKTQDIQKAFKEFNLFEKRDDEDLFEYFYSIFILLIFNLDKVFSFYYMKYKSFYYFKKAQKEIVTLTKEIKYYEYKL